MLSKYKRALFLTVLISYLSYSQECDKVISGEVQDLNLGLPVFNAVVRLEGTDKHTLTDSHGKFVIDGVCLKDAHLLVSHVAYTTSKVFVSSKNMLYVSIELVRKETQLGVVVLRAKTLEIGNQNLTAINRQDIQDSPSQNLSNLLQRISGVNAIRTGATISKPVIHGLYGNRVAILNNEIVQSGQQWGNDHSPEIDPLVADQISVIKGVSALEYGGNHLGGIVIVTPQKIAKDPHLHGRAIYFFESNGLKNGLNLQVEQGSEAVSWKINTTLKKGGDLTTPYYYLKNTGSEEFNIAFQLEKKLTEKWNTDLYLSTFNTNIGILRGAHIGNLTDFKQALLREEPFFTESEQSFNITAPKQEVRHHLLKLKTNYFFTDKHFLSVFFSTQIDDRKEFDIRRGGRSEKPALSLVQVNYFTQAKYNYKFENEVLLKLGIQNNYTNNTNTPGTGILPLIPDYISLNTSMFLVVNIPKNRWNFELGGRYKNGLLNVATVTKALEIVRYNRSFDNFSSTFGTNFTSDILQIKYNTGIVQRNPAVNELYSFGLHQGISGIEEGNSNLDSEISLKTDISVRLHKERDFSIEILGYFQKFKDYIFLQPEPEPRLTIRGTFPVYTYQQTDAQIYGLDVSTHLHFLKSFTGSLNYSFLRGDDTEKNKPLVYMPPNNLKMALKYESRNFGKFEDIEIEILDSFIFEQKHLLPDQDFQPPPEAYNLLGLTMSANITLQKIMFRLNAKINNLLNTTYRDYLNRQRYFADALGINVALGLQLKF